MLTRNKSSVLTHSGLQVEDQPILSHIPYFGDRQDEFINELADDYEDALIGEDVGLPGTLASYCMIILMCTVYALMLVFVLVVSCMCANDKFLLWWGGAFMCSDTMHSTIRRIMYCFLFNCP